MNAHGVEFDQDEEGWDFATCLCGWKSPPVPGVDIAADMFAEHYAFEKNAGRDEHA